MALKREFMPFVMIFHFLKQRWPIINFEGCKESFDFLKVPKKLY
jgi:hypothetical protein